MNTTPAERPPSMSARRFCRGRVEGVGLAGTCFDTAVPQFGQKSMSSRIGSLHVEQIIEFLENNGMLIDRPALIDCHRNGLSLPVAKDIYEDNKTRYENYTSKLDQSKQRSGVALFNAFLIDCQRHQRRTHFAPYAPSGEHQK